MSTWELLEKVRKEKPLVHHITNWVTIYDCANIVKSFGASPVMAHAKEEVADMASIASSLVLNIGTLTSELIESMKLAACAANKKGIPVILDVCGAGATPFRDSKVREILKSAKVNIIKGNASEIARVAGMGVKTKGVDSGSVDADLSVMASELAAEKSCTVVITGKEDIISDSSRVYRVSNGADMMGAIVGTGCMAASVIGAFAAVEKDLARASASALVCFGIAAEIASGISMGTGSFKNDLFDCVYNLNREQVETREKLA
ncbi:MAG: hydroxyethylthiazole kinase [Elusimicrobia bacterium CG_4_10_14_3_um_filter_49_12_50_7]|nr:MAG: hydroxyethylthiazole kinase [Elusimicrobia bacterium CG03_land_8_20_14_0_80_50_18]PIX14044.1 MAG: hydroxyethylthiazole kinase [Elusimicrobia bacterium CG_4_8_14_3_um_filter_50_9]PIY16680.1 MAG: hydroxyethylthiazole kinase [Elusimicrobia bacterium CG_4_10_14_3_um_filter_49_12_50_7]